MQSKRVALIVGENGIVGRNVAKYLQSRDNWDEVIITSYRVHTCMTISPSGLICWQVISLSYTC